MTRYIIQSKLTLLYVKEFDNGSLKMTSNQAEAFRYYYLDFARLELYKNELDTRLYDLIPFKGV